jgi:hypothetical protein
MKIVDKISKYEGMSVRERWPADEG